MDNQVGSGSAKGLVEFLELLVEKGRATQGGVIPLKTALKQILSVVDGKDKWQDVNMREIDINDHMDRFAMLTRGKYSKSSLKTYKSRLQKAVSWYISFLNEPGWTPPKSGNGNIVKKPILVNNITKQVVENQVDDESDTFEKLIDNFTQVQVKSDLIAYPFPLRPGKIVNLYLPVDLSLSEAKRLGRYLESLSVDDSKADD